MTCWLCGSETTNIFTNTESPTCKDGPCQVCTAVTKVDEEINQVAVTLRRLLVKRCNLRSEQNRVHGSLMHRLPIELKNYIFQLLLPLRDNWGRIEAPGVIMPLYLTSVCRGWRDIAWSNPLFWSTIHIRTRRQVSRTSDRISFLRSWILRSRTMPLTLHLDVDYFSDNEELKGVIHAINQCSNRWHSLSLDIPLKMTPFFRHMTSTCQHLKRLRISSRDPNRSAELEPFLNLEVSPEVIEICRVPFRSLQISWSHLSFAKVESIALEDIVQLFQHAHQMTYCHISSPLSPAINFSMPLITHRRLKALRLSGRPRIGAMLLRSLTLPCLQEFHGQMDLLTHLPALVQFSSCPLTGITLLGFYHELGINDLQPLTMVTDVDLELECLTHGGRDILEKLLLEEYFPNLRHLTLGLKSFLDLWNCGIFFNLLHSKWLWAGAPNESKIRVIDHRRGDEFDPLIWEIGRELMSPQFKVIFREDGFELLPVLEA